MAGRLDAVAIMSKTLMSDAADTCPWPTTIAETNKAMSDGNKTIETESTNGLKKAKLFEPFDCDLESMDDVVDVMVVISYAQSC